MKYLNNRKLCWNRLTQVIKVRLDGKYTIEAEDFHLMKKAFLSTKPENEDNYSRGWKKCKKCKKCKKWLCDCDKPTKPEKEFQCEVCMGLFYSYKNNRGKEEHICQNCYYKPSPLDEIEEIEEVEEPTVIENCVNILIRNQKKIIRYLKKR